MDRATLEFLAICGVGPHGSYGAYGSYGPLGSLGSLGSLGPSYVLGSLGSLGPSYAHTDNDCRNRALRRGLHGDAYLNFGHPFALEHCEHSCMNHRSLHYQIYQMMKNNGKISLDEAHKLMAIYKIDHNGNLYRVVYNDKKHQPMPPTYNEPATPIVPKNNLDMLRRLPDLAQYK